jgi:hypothetical protein
MADVKIVPHVFHSFYTFDYFEPELEAGAPKLLYADWPIINRIPMGAKPPNGGNVKKFTSEKEIRQWIENKSDIKEEDYCQNFIKISKDDFDKYRQLFHGLIKHHEIEHKFEASIKVEGKGIGSATRSVGVQAVNENPTSPSDGDPDGPCVDFVNGVGNKAIIPGEYKCSYVVDDDGEVSWGGGREKHSATGPGPCYGAGGGEFTTTFKKCDKMRCSAGSWGGPNVCNGQCYYEEPENLSEEEQEKALDCCCPPEVAEDGSGGSGGGGNPSTSSSIGIPINKEKDTIDFNERVLFIEQLANTTSSLNPKWRDAKDYECTRSHSKIVNGDLLYDGAKTFSEDGLQKRIGGRESRKRSIKDIEPPKKDPSKEDGAYREDSLELQSKKVFKKEWEFDNEKFKELFKNSKIFPRNATRINDPIFEYLVDTKSGYLKIFTYIQMLAGPKKESFLKGSKKLTSDKLGEYSLNFSSERMSSKPEEDVVTYYISTNINYTAYIESKKEYLIFFDVSCKLDLGDIALSWSAGDFQTGNKDEDTGKYIESVYPKFKNDIPYDDIALYSVKKNFSAEEGKKENGKITKIKIPISFVFEGSPEDKEIELFRFEKKEAEVKDNPTCVKNKGKASWDLDKLKFEIHGWWQNDFKRGTSFPAPIT